MRLRIPFAIFLALAGARPGLAGEAGSARTPLAFLSDFRGGGHLLYYFNHPDAAREERFVSQGGMEVDFSFVSRPDRWHARLRFEILAGMGESVAENLPFSPKEMAYDINPYLEYRAGGRTIRAGLAHMCRHLIYKDDETPWYLEEGTNFPSDVYFNRLYAGIGSAEAQAEERWQTLLRSDGDRAQFPRAIWRAEVAGYLRSLGGLMDAESLSGGNDWQADAKVDLMLPLRVRPACAWFAASRTQVLFDTHFEPTWIERLELEAIFANREYGTSIFLAWNVVDEHPLDSREELVELGARFFF